MTQLLPPLLREEPDAEAIIKEARRLRRRRWLIGTSTALLVIACVAGAVTLSLRNGQSPPAVTFEGPQSLLPGRAPLDQSILVSPAGLSDGSMSGNGTTELTVVDPANGSHQAVQPFADNTLWTFPWIASGDEVVAVNGLQGTEGIPQVGTAVAFSPTRPQSVRTLGRASFAVDAYTRGDVWLVVDPNFGGTPVSDAGCTVEEVSLAGRVIFGTRPYPCGWTIDGPAPTGLLVTAAPTTHGIENAPAILSVWNPVENAVEARYRYAPNPQVNGDTGKFVLWNKCGSNPCAPDRFTNLTTGRTAVLPFLPDGWLVDSSYVLAPNGSFAAVVAISGATADALRSGQRQIKAPCCYFGVRAIPSEMFVYNLRTDRLVESRPLVAASRLAVRWSADNAYLFLTLDLKRIEAVPLWSDVAPIRVSAAPGGEFAAAVPSESFLPLPAA